MKVDVTKWVLETWERPPLVAKSAIAIRRTMRPNPDLNRFFYRTVGREWLWHTRLTWSDSEWLAVIDQTAYETWLGYIDESPSGFLEMDREHPSRVEIAYFGLLPSFVGKGFGGPMLARCLEEAWQPIEVESVWLSTCSLDHPGAMTNYFNYGFKIVRTEFVTEDIPSEMVAERRSAIPEAR